MKRTCILFCSLLTICSCSSSIQGIYYPSLHSNPFGQNDINYQLFQAERNMDSLQQKNIIRLEVQPSQIEISAFNRAKRNGWAFGGGSTHSPPTPILKSKCKIKNDTLFMFNERYLIKGDTLFKLPYSQYCLLRNK